MKHAPPMAFILFFILGTMAQKRYWGVQHSATLTNQLEIDQIGELKLNTYTYNTQSTYANRQKIWTLTHY